MVLRILQPGKLRVSRLSLLMVIELVVGSTEVQTGRFESWLLSTQSWGSPAAAECGGSMAREVRLAVFLHGWRVNRPSLCLPTSGLVLLCPALSPELVRPLNPVCLPGGGDMAQDRGQASEAESSLGCGTLRKDSRWGVGPIPRVPSGGSIETGLGAAIKSLVPLLTTGQGFYSCDFHLL